MKTFFRIANPNTLQGLWYDYQGEFTGLIHNQFDFCENSGLQMPFDPQLKGYLSATESLEQLYQWFPQADILRLQKAGYVIHEYQSDDYKFYDPYQHLVINQAKSLITNTILL